MQPPIYITTPIYYVNDSPHLGHAYTTVAADVLARYYRLAGHEVRFLTGTDEHGQKVDKAAKAAGIDPQAFTDEVSQRFRRLVHCPESTGENVLNATNDDFIRTTEARHKKAAQTLWKRMADNGHIELGNYGGWYSVRDEAYYQESELIEKDGKKLAPTGAEVEWVEEESYFFDLSKWQDKLLEFYESNPDFVTPQSRMNEVRSFVEGGLKDLSISRTTFNWGVPVPDAPGHVMYVWIDALTNYLTSLGFPDNMENVEKFWENAIHIVGKDILRFHAVYWPAFLMAADLPLPKKVVAHGWWTVEGEKMSKSIGNVISPDEAIERAGGVDQLRYFLLRAMPFGNDGDFSRSRMVEVINADLANNIGNLAQRTLSMIQKNCEGKVPGKELLGTEDKNLLASVRNHILSMDNHFEKCRYHTSLEMIMKDSAKANDYIDKQAPWKLKKENPERMNAVLYTLAEAIRCISILLQPFCPTAAGKLLDQLAIPKGERMFSHLTEEFALKPGTELPAPQGVFPRLDVNKDEAA